MTLLDKLIRTTDAMVDDLETLVMAETPTADLEAIEAGCSLLSEMGKRLLGDGPEVVRTDGRPHLLWKLGRPRVLLLGHLDTVWPRGTTMRWPFSVKDGVASGPGAFDMKAGVVQGLHAVSAFEDPEGVAVLITSDEETGGHSSRELIERVAQEVDAVLVLEASGDGALKVARKGASFYEVFFHGRAAHAGLDPDRGINALIELAHVVTALSSIARPSVGTTVTPTVAHAGTTSNTIPATALLQIDVRAPTANEQARVDEALHALDPVVEGAEMTIVGGPNRGPLEPTASVDLFEQASAVASEIGIAPLWAIGAGGVSDGNFTAALGRPTLDGLGAVGDGAHAEGEHVLVDRMPERAALVAGLVKGLLENPVGGPKAR
ncbi:MAG: glutamate carboxypeptidase [Actinomycetota bacterium]|nr:glutamate carboxypeptidase [Actinomycetota bacterium]